MLRKTFKIDWHGNVGRINTGIQQPACRADGKLVFAGDIALARGVGKAIDNTSPDAILSNVSNQLFDSSDYFIFNLECCITDRGNTWEPNKRSPMVGKPRYLEIFPSEYRGYIANLSNNHLLDLGIVGASDTVEALENRDIEYFGVKQFNKNKISTVYVKDTSIAFVAFSPAAHPIPEDNAPINVYTGKTDQFERDVKKACMEHDLTIVNLHQGIEYSPFIMRSARLLARKAIDLGAHCVICHHAHVIQGIEMYERRMIFHGIGNFLIDVNFNKHPLARYSLVPYIFIQDKKIQHIEIQAFKIQNDLSIDLLTSVELETVKRMIEIRSRFVSSTMGCLMNDVIAGVYRLKDRSRAAVKMFRRKGVKLTFAYYFNRLFRSRH
ncbi:MAG: CapA family protein [Anaerolineaceae bacterium]|nr:MAG: CapA family protein [Anaerolineaceae bacterium]